MTVLIAIATLDVGHIAGLGAVLRHVALLTTVAATAGTSLGAILGKMTHFGSRQYS